LNHKSILSVILFLAVIALSWFSYSVLIPANPMPLTSPTFELNSNTARQLYAKSAALVFSGTYVTQVQVVIYNDAGSRQTATVTVQIYDWDGNLLSGGLTSVTVPRRDTATATVNLPTSVPYSSVGRVVVNVA
jgi:type 1 fimbria pilin